MDKNDNLDKGTARVPKRRPAIRAGKTKNHTYQELPSDIRFRRGRTLWRGNHACQ